MEENTIDSDKAVTPKNEKPAGKEISRAEMADRWTEVLSTILLAIVAVLTAWSGYQSTRWSGVQADDYAQGSAKRLEADRSATLGGQDRIYDLEMFNNWLNAYSTDQTDLADRYVRRFREEFLQYFNAWLATDPFNNVNAPAGPLVMPEYHTQRSVDADRLEKEALDLTDSAREANDFSDNYVFVTVFLAVALFFVAVAQRFDWALIKWIVLILATGILILAVIRLAVLPVN
jgi:hypothetical protein